MYIEPLLFPIIAFIFEDEYMKILPEVGQGVKM